MPQCPDLAGFVVAVNVSAKEFGKAFAVIHITAGDARSLGVRMRGHGRNNGLGALGFGFDRLARLIRAPAMVAATLHEMNHFPQLPADIAAPQTPLGVEADLPRIAKAEGPDFRPGLRCLQKRIVGRNGVGLAVVRMIHVDAQDGRQQIADVLSGVQRVGRGGDLGVPGGNVEHAIGTELQ